MAINEQLEILEAQLNFLHASFENKEECCVILNQEGKIIQVNKAFRQFTQLDYSDILNKFPEELHITHPDDEPLYLESLQRCKNDLTEVYITVSVKIPAHRYAKVQMAIVPLFKKDSFIGIQIEFDSDTICFSHHHFCARQYQELADALGDFFFALDRNFKFTYWNKSIEQFTGIKRDKIKGHTFYEFYEKEPYFADVIDFFTNVMESGIAQQKNIQYIHFGNPIDLDITAFPTSSGISVLAKKIQENPSLDNATKLNTTQNAELLNTEYKQVIADLIAERNLNAIREEKIKEQARLLDTVFQNTLDSIVLLDKDYNFLKVSKSYAVSCARPVDFFIGKNHFDLYPSNLKDEFDICKEKKLIFQRFARKFVFPDHPEWGETYWDLVLIPIFDETNEIEMFIFTLKDVSREIAIKNELQQLIHKARESEEVFAKAFQYAPVMMTISSLEDGTYIDVNNEFLKTSGFKYDEVIGKTSVELGWLDAETRASMISKLNNEGRIEAMPMTLKNKANERVYCIYRGELISIGGKQRLLSLAIDETSRHKYEEDLSTAKDLAEASERRFRAIVENSPNGLLIYETDGKCSYANNSAARLLGGTNEALLAQDFYELESWKRSEMLVTATTCLREKKIACTEIHTTSTFGKEIWYDAYFIPIEYANDLHLLILLNDVKEQKLAQELLTQKNQEIEKQNLELKYAIEKAEESDKLKTAFLQNMSHEIRTPLNAICGFTNMLGHNNLQEDKKHNFINIIKNSSNQLLQIVTDILTIASIETNQETVNIEPVSVNDLLIELLNQYKLQLKNHNLAIFTHITLSASASECYTDRQKLYQILNNLLANALKFTIYGSIDFGYELIKHSTDEPHDEIGYLEFFVKDTGIGIKKEYHQSIFEPFRQVDTSESRRYGSTGLGLSISKAFVELLGGSMRVESELGKGAAFYFTLPYKPLHNQVDNTLHNKPLVLVAEDEEINFLYIEQVLSELDYKVIHAKNGKEAIEKTLENPFLEFIIMDIKMPVMDGHTATLQIKQFRPEIPVIALTAYALESEIKKYKEIFDFYVTKPHETNDLIEVIKKCTAKTSSLQLGK